MAYEGILADVFATGEAIKSAREQSAFHKLQAMYMGRQDVRAASTEQRAQAQEQRQQTQFTQDQQVANTKLANAAAAEIVQNPGAIARWLPQLKQAGVLPAEFDPATVPPEQLQAMAKQVFDQTTASLNAMAGPQDTGPLTPYVGPDGQPVLGTRDEAHGQRPYDKPPQTQITLDTKQETAEHKAVGEQFGKQYGDIQQAGFDADKKVNRLERMSQLAGDIDTNRLTPVGATAASYLRAVGIDVDPSLPQKEAAMAISNELTLQARNPSGGAGMPGAMSDSDRNFLAAMSPNLSQTKQGRALVIESGKALAQRDKEVAKMARDYRRRHEQFDEGFFDELAEWSSKNSLFAGKYTTGTGQNGEKWVLYNGEWIQL